MSGNTWSARLKMLLLCNSTVIIPRDVHQAFWWHLLEPGVHYAEIDPLEPGTSPERLEEVVRVGVWQKAWQDTTYMSHAWIYFSRLASYGEGICLCIPPSHHPIPLPRIFIMYIEQAELESGMPPPLPQPFSFSAHYPARPLLHAYCMQLFQRCCKERLKAYD